MATKICLSGLTAAGKTTHSLALAQALGFRHIDVADLIADLRNAPHGALVWGDQFDQVEAERDASDLDARLDAQLVELAHDDVDTVFDSWALPWTARGVVCSLWIESDFESRVRKSVVTELRRGRRPDFDESRYLLTRKDEATRQRFIQDHGFDIYTDRSVFAAVMDNSCLIPAASIPISDCGIEIFKPVLLQVLASVLNLPPVPEPPAEVSHYLRPPETKVSDRAGIR